MGTDCQDGERKFTLSLSAEDPRKRSAEAGKIELYLSALLATPAERESQDRERKLALPLPFQRFSCLVRIFIPIYIQRKDEEGL